MEGTDETEEVLRQRTGGEYTFLDGNGLIVLLGGVNFSFTGGMNWGDSIGSNPQQFLRLLEYNSEEFIKNIENEAKLPNFTKFTYFILK